MIRRGFSTGNKLSFLKLKLFCLWQCRRKISFIFWSVSFGFLNILMVHFIFLPFVLLPSHPFLSTSPLKVYDKLPWHDMSFSDNSVSGFFCTEGMRAGSDFWPLMLWKCDVAFIQGWEASVAVAFPYWVGKLKRQNHNLCLQIQRICTISALFQAPPAYSSRTDTGRIRVRTQLKH